MIRFDAYQHCFEMIVLIQRQDGEFTWPEVDMLRDFLQWVDDGIVTSMLLIKSCSDVYALPTVACQLKEIPAFAFSTSKYSRSIPCTWDQQLKQHCWKGKTSG
jgi:hypothetical protein